MSVVGWLSQPAVLPWAALVFGLCVGSFLNVVIHRMPRMMYRDWLEQIPDVLEESTETRDREESKRLAKAVRAQTAHFKKDPIGLAQPRSRCPGCLQPIAAYHNIPLVSWIALRARCAKCGTRISAVYPLVELLAGLGTVWSVLHFGLTLAALGAAVFIWCTIALAFIDQKTGLLPDEITLPLLWLGLLLNAAGTFVPLKDAVTGAAAGYLFLWMVYWGFKLVFHKEGMGYGDFKMTAAVGAFLGWKILPIAILISALVGIVFGVGQMLAVRKGWETWFKVHFGPYIAIAGVIAMFWGSAIMERFPVMSFG
jgi:leader peptidase (prepilin peptidase)/N-methyltransferase